MGHGLRRGTLRKSLGCGMVAATVLLALPGPARAEAPYPSPEATSPAHPAASDPYAYEDYAYIDPGTGDCSTGVNPEEGDRDLPENFDCKNDWKFTNYSAKPGDPDFDPAVASNLAELGPSGGTFGVKGSKLNLGWEVTTGRPDVLIAVMDSGIRWDGRESVSGDLDGGELNRLNGLRKKLFLNRGELPRPEGEGCADPGFGGYDRNCDGIFNVLDFAPPGTEPQDPTLDGCITNCVTDVNANTLLDPEDLILTYSDTEDDDGNGYPDDISGWDFFEDDNDANDDVDYGHGTGESLDSGYEAEARTTTGALQQDDGTCPNCMLLEMRVGDSFIADVNHWAEAVVYATDNGASIVQEALGTLNNSSFGQAAANYAYRRGVVIVASAADESAAHHNYPSSFEHTMVVNSVTKYNDVAGTEGDEFPAPFPNPPPLEAGQTPKSYLYFNGCTNFGGHIHVAVPSSGCSSEATGRSAGYAGLVYSAALNAIARGQITPYVKDNGELASYPLSAEEVMQIFRIGAEDIDFRPPALGGPSTTGYTTAHVSPSRRFQSVEGWDMFFGYGRTDVRAMLDGAGFDRTASGPLPLRIPPEADITSPGWFKNLPDRGEVAIRGRVAANRSSGFTYKVEWAAGVQPYALPGDEMCPWHEVASGSRSSALTGRLATLDMAEVAAEVRSCGPGVFEPGSDPTSELKPEKDAFRVRVTVTDDEDDANVGVFQKQFFVRPEGQRLLPGWPRRLGSDGAGGPAFADLDSDGTDELVVSTSDGFVHAYKADGSEARGWPVHTRRISLPRSGDNAYTRGRLRTPVYAPVLLGSPAIADVVPGDDGDPEVAVADLEGRVYLFNDGGSLVRGWPRSVARRLSEEPGCEDIGVSSPGELPPCDDFRGDGSTASYAGELDHRDKFNAVDHGLNHNPMAVDLDPSTRGLELVAGAGDNHVYAWRSHGARVPGWPVLLRDPAKANIDPQTHKITYKPGAAPFMGSKIVVAPSAGDVDDDGDLEIAATVNEEYDEDPNSSRLRDQLGPILGAISKGGNGRVYLLDHRGTLTPHPEGEADNPDHPNEQTYLPGWPAKIATLQAELLPYVGEGPDGSPTIANVDDDPQLEIGIAMHAGPGYILELDGESHFGNGPDGKDITLATDEYKNPNARDAPSFVAVGGGSFGELVEGEIAWAAPTGGLIRLLDVVLAAQQIGQQDFVAAWDMELGSFFTGFPAEVHDLQFFTVPSIADVDGDGSEPEVIEGSSVYDVQAYNASGAPVEGFPKFTGGWNLAPAAAGDLNSDGKLDIASVTREGWLYVWTTEGAACQEPQWPKYQHDLANTGNYEAPVAKPAGCSAPEPNRSASVRLSPREVKSRPGRGRRFVVTVRDSEGDPITGAQVEWNERGPGRFVSKQTRTDASGTARAVVRSVKRGDQSVTASSPSCGSSARCSDASVVHWGPRRCDVYGTEGDDVLLGSPARETLCGFGGDDVIRAAGGRDVLWGFGGDDVMRGRRGDDRLLGAAGDDFLRGDAGRDRVMGNAGSDGVRGGSGHDLLLGDRGDDRLFGRRGDDRLQAGAGADELRGGAGRDSCRSGRGRDRVSGCDP